VSSVVDDSDVPECLCRTANYNDTDRCTTCRLGYNLSAHCLNCTRGFYDEDCVLPQLACDVMRCGGRGNCTGQYTGCACLPAYQGSTCSESRCTGAGTPSSNGMECVCEFPNHPNVSNPLHCVLVCHPVQGRWISGACQCLPGYGGAFCAEAVGEPVLSVVWVVVIVLSASAVTAFATWMAAIAFQRRRDGGSL
jgi:hypothetical protein